MTLPRATSSAATSSGVGAHAVPTPRLPADDAVSSVELSVVLPCLNEAETLATCIRKAKRSFAELGVAGEVVVADNGSTDGSQDIARAEGAVVVDVPRRGYGAALIAGIRASRGEYVLMADADDSYALDDLGGFLRELRDGADLVMGNRFRGRIEPGAMPFLHRYVGNPVLSLVGRLLLPHPRRRLPLRHPRLPPRPGAGARAGHVRHGVRQRDGGPGVAGGAAHPRGADRAPARRPDPRPAPAHLARRLAAPALPARVQPALAAALPVDAVPGRRAGRDAVAAPRAARGRGGWSSTSTPCWPSRRCLCWACRGSGWP